MSAALGTVFAVGSAIFNGSFASLFKTRKIAALSLDPMVFQLYVSMGVFLSSWLVLPFLSKNAEIVHSASAGTEFRFSPLGMVSGFLLVLSLAASFSAIDCIGVALAQGIWGGGAMIVAYLWGRVIFGEVPAHPVLSVFGLVLLVVGVLGIVFCDKIGRMIPLRNNGGDGYAPLTSSEDDSSSVLLGDSNSNSSHRYTRGVLLACAVGFTGGSNLAPLHFVPPSQEGLVFLPSFGIGAMLLSPIVFYIHTLCRGDMPEFHVREALPTGLCSGLLWNTGNLLSIVAIPAVGYGVAYPIYQCAILVSGLIGIYVFKEIKLGVTIAVFWMSGAVLLLGGVLLASSQS